MEYTTSASHICAVPEVGELSALITAELPNEKAIAESATAAAESATAAAESAIAAPEMPVFAQVTTNQMLDFLNLVINKERGGSEVSAQPVSFSNVSASGCRKFTPATTSNVTMSGSSLANRFPS